MKINSFPNIQQFNFRQQVCPTACGIKNSKDLFLYNIDKKPQAILRQELMEGRRQLLQPVSTPREYDLLSEEIFNYKNVPNSNGLLPPFICTCGYENIDKDLKGLIAYCGCDDKSNEINSWLTARPFSKEMPLNDEQMAKIIRVMDYSLKKLDERFGKYSGTVYRSGFFNPLTDKQYYSTAAAPICAVKHSQEYIPSEKNSYSIIKLKNGHNIDAFQHQANSFFSRKFSQTEQEVLIDRTSKFRLVPKEQYSSEDKKLVSELINQAIDFGCNKIYKDLNRSSENNYEKYISVWEEI